MFISTPAYPSPNLRKLSLQCCQLVSSVLGSHVGQDNIERGTIDILIGHGADHDTEQSTQDAGDTMEIVHSTAIVKVQCVKEEWLENLRWNSSR